jgi:hypothetical protein
MIGGKRQKENYKRKGAWCRFIPRPVRRALFARRLNRIPVIVSGPSLAAAYNPSAELPSTHNLYTRQGFFRASCLENLLSQKHAPACVCRGIANSLLAPASWVAGDPAGAQPRGGSRSGGAA